MVNLGDSVTLSVTRSSRLNKKSGSVISNFKRSSSRVLGGYLTCEKKRGAPLAFAVHRAPPSILSATSFSYRSRGSAVELHSHRHVDWGEEVELAVPLDRALTDAQPVLSVTLSSGETAVFLQKEVLANAGTSFWVSAGGAGKNKSRLHVQFDCFLGNDMVKDRKIGERRGAGFWLRAAGLALGAAALAGAWLRRSKLEIIPGYVECMSSDGDVEGVCGAELEASAKEEGPWDVGEVKTGYLWSSSSVAVGALLGGFSLMLATAGVLAAVFGVPLTSIEVSYFMLEQKKEERGGEGEEASGEKQMTRLEHKNPLPECFVVSVAKVSRMAFSV